MGVNLETRRGLTQHDIAEYLVVGHLYVTDGDAEAEHLLQLELDRRAHLGDLVREVLRVRNGRRELSSCERKGTVRTPSDGVGWEATRTHLWKDRGQADGESA